MRGQRERRKGRDRKYLAPSLQAFAERGRGEGGSEALPVEDKETGRGLKQSAFAFPQTVHQLKRGKVFEKQQWRGIATTGRIVETKIRACSFPPLPPCPTFFYSCPKNNNFFGRGKEGKCAK